MNMFSCQYPFPTDFPWFALRIIVMVEMPRWKAPHRSFQLLQQHPNIGGPCLEYPSGTSYLSRSFNSVWSLEFKGLQYLAKTLQHVHFIRFYHCWSLKLPNSAPENSAKVLGEIDACNSARKTSGLLAQLEVGWTWARKELPWQNKENFHGNHLFHRESTSENWGKQNMFFQKTPKTESLIANCDMVQANDASFFLSRQCGRGSVLKVLPLT